MELRFIGHATVLIDFGDVRVLTDPFLGHRLGPLERQGPCRNRRPGGCRRRGDLARASRPLRPGVVARAGSGPVVVVPRGLGRSVHRATGGEVVELSVGEQTAIGALTITAVPARHWVSPGAPRGQPIGYVLEDGARVYFAGDTGPFPGMADLVAAADVALLPVWTWGPHLGPGHLGPRAAAEVLAEAGPTVAVPIHWGTLYPTVSTTSGDDRSKSRAIDSPRTLPSVAPKTDVRVLRPGESTLILSDGIRASRA